MGFFVRQFETGAHRGIRGLSAGSDAQIDADSLEVAVR